MDPLFVLIAGVVFSAAGLLIASKQHCGRLKAFYLRSFTVDDTQAATIRRLLGCESAPKTVSLFDLLKANFNRAPRVIKKLNELNASKPFENLADVLDWLETNLAVEAGEVSHPILWSKAFDATDAFAKNYVTGSHLKIDNALRELAVLYVMRFESITRKIDQRLTREIRLARRTAIKSQNWLMRTFFPGARTYFYSILQPSLEYDRGQVKKYYERLHASAKLSNKINSGLILFYQDTRFFQGDTVLLNKVEKLDAAILEQMKRDEPEAESA